jgi:hypothetical protein
MLFHLTPILSNCFHLLVSSFPSRCWHCCCAATQSPSLISTPPRPDVQCVFARGHSALLAVWIVLAPLARYTGNPMFLFFPANWIQSHLIDVRLRDLASPFFLDFGSCLSKLPILYHLRHVVPVLSNALLGLEIAGATRNESPNALLLLKSTNRRRRRQVQTHPAWRCYDCWRSLFE